ncbi:MAG TPA: proton-conducting transporter membrane subunit, partial [Gemmataceae bacterium]|nr:proton-conducting transporter membrane subunit [Gemmataceae bacterium]
MLSPDQIRFVLPALLGLPVLAAIVLRFLGGSRAHRAAVAFAGTHLALTLLILLSGASAVQHDPAVSAKIDLAKKQAERVFAPQFVPGDPNPNGTGSYSTAWDLLTFHGPDANNPGGRVRLGAAQFFIGLDGLNIWLVALASFLMLPVVLFSADSVREREGPYYSWLFLLQAALLGVFLAFDILLFYVFFELTLVPLLFLIGGWGPGPNRREAARTLFL